MHEKVAQPAVTNAILKRHGFHMRKGLGQNFLTDPQILQKIVAAADVSEQDDVIEIGPGIGALTQFLADQAHQVVALEIDDRLLPILAETQTPHGQAGQNCLDFLPLPRVLGAGST